MMHLCVTPVANLCIEAVPAHVSPVLSILAFSHSGSTAAPRRNKPVSHLLHCPQKPITEPYFEEMQKSVTKIKTMGPPADIKLRCIPHRVRPQSCGGVPRTAAKKSKAPGGAVRLDPDTFRSKIPMKWHVGGGPVASNYQVRPGPCPQRRRLWLHATVCRFFTSPVL